MVHAFLSSRWSEIRTQELLPVSDCSQSAGPSCSRDRPFICKIPSEGLCSVLSGGPQTAPDSASLMHVGDVSACTFVPLVIRRCWITASENHNPPSPGVEYRPLLLHLFFLFSAQTQISAGKYISSGRRFIYSLSTDRLTCKVLKKKSLK